MRFLRLLHDQICWNFALLIRGNERDGIRFTEEKMMKFKVGGSVISTCFGVGFIPPSDTVAKYVDLARFTGLPNLHAILRRPRLTGVDLCGRFRIARNATGVERPKNGCHATETRRRK
jgi:hypothetical protein